MGGTGFCFETSPSTCGLQIDSCRSRKTRALLVHKTGALPVPSYLVHLLLVLFAPAPGCFPLITEEHERRCSGNGTFGVFRPSNTRPKVILRRDSAGAFVARFLARTSMHRGRGRGLLQPPDHDDQNENNHDAHTHLDWLRWESPSGSTTQSWAFGAFGFQRANRSAALFAPWKG